MATANLAIQTHFRNLKDPRRAPRHLLNALGVEHIAIDGKTLRRSK